MKELWDNLYKIYTTTNTQAVINMKQKFESFRFDDKTSFNMHIRRYKEICDEIAAYGQRIDDASLVRIIFKSLPRLIDRMDKYAAHENNLTSIKTKI